MKPGIDTQELSANVSPKHDLFKHVNGSWLDQTEIPEDKAVFGSFYMLADDAELAVKEILEEAASNPRPGVSQQIGDLYSSFLDEDRIEKAGLGRVQEGLEKIAAVSSLKEFFTMIGALERAGVGGLWGSYVDNDPGNPERYLVHVYQGGLGLPDKDYYFDEKYAEIREEYVPHISRVMMLAGHGATQAIDIAKDIFELESKIAKLHWSKVEARDAEKTYNLRDFATLQSMNKNLDWEAYLQGASLKPDFMAESVVMMPSFIEGMADVLIEDNLESLKSWLSWVTLRSYAPYLPTGFVNERFAFYGTKLTGQPVNRPRWKRAVSLVEGSLGEAVGQIYVEKHFPPASKSAMDELVGHLIAAYEQSIKELSWMTDETKAKALEKLHKFTPKIGYPDKWKDYSSIEISREDLIGNVMNVSSWEFDYHANKVGAPIDRDEWHMNPQTVNAYYNPGLNEIVFPAAILQPPFFSADADDAVNFGGIGGVIGHEIGHGFDDQGSKYDGDGKLVSWWTKDDREAFEKLTKSLIDQYNALTPVGLDEKYKVNGELTIGENIGDLGGLGIAWKAYIISLNGKEPPVIDGMSAAERFLISWAQCWRGKSRDEIAIQRLATDPHSPAEFRCNQVVKNLDIFHETFDVQPGDEMWLEPEKRVVIW